MNKLIITALLTSLYFTIKVLFNHNSHLQAESTALTGLILITAYLFAISLKRLRLPKLTGYMLLGVIFGPLGLKFLNNEVLEQLKFLENLALAFIAITAGGEFKYERIKKLIKSVLFLLSGQIIVVFLGLLIILIGLSPYIPFTASLDKNLLYGFAILFSATAISKSPATTIGIITELRAKGKLTDIVLSVTVLKSIFLVITFPLFIAWAKFYLVAGTTLNYEMLKSLFIQISGSMMSGVIIGLIVIGYLKYVKIERSIFLLGVAIIITEVTQLYNIEILLTSLVVGIIVENFSSQGDNLIKGIEKSSLPLYIIFFSFAGAGLHLDTLQNAFVLTIVLVIARMALIYFGTSLGAVISGESKIIRDLSWMGFIGQAGIAIGLAKIIENTFPGEIGLQFKTILVASVVINELLGPIFFKYILIKAKEGKVEG